MTTAQVIFVIALAVAALIVTSFAVFVISSTMWGDRWLQATQVHQSKGDESERDQVD